MAPCSERVKNHSRKEKKERRKKGIIRDWEKLSRGRINTLSGHAAIFNLHVAITAVCNVEVTLSLKKYSGDGETEAMVELMSLEESESQKQ